jgi:hypothetical protein
MQWRLLPQPEHIALLNPISAAIGEAKVKIPDDPSQDESHLHIGETAPWLAEAGWPDLRVKNLLSSKAVSWAKRERLEHALLVNGKTGIIAPSLGNERVGKSEVLGVSVQRVLRYAHDGLSHQLAYDISPRRSERYVYLRRKKITTDHSALGVHFPINGIGDGWVHAQCLIQDGQHICQVSHALKGDFALVLK